MEHFATTVQLLLPDRLKLSGILIVDNVDRSFPARRSLAI